MEIAGVEYTEKDIVSCSASGGLFQNPSIGNCASRQLQFKIIPKGEIPRQAEVKVFVRLVLGDTVSEWIPKGVFYFSTRKLDSESNVLSVNAYDAMLKTEQIWLTDDYDDAPWPMPQSDAVADIASRIGVEVDGRTVLSSEFPVAYPTDENGDFTMREVLAYIAVANAGNWIITDAGKLRLIGFADVLDETSYLITEYGDAITFGGMRIIV